MAVTVEAPANLPRLPAAVEVAAYRIATEAVTNSARNSGADLAWVCIKLGDDCLTVTVRDPGPMTEAWTPASEYRPCGNGPPKSAAPSRSPATRRDPRYTQSCPSADPGRPPGRWTSANGSSAGIMITSDAMPKDPSARAWHPQDMETGGRPDCGVLRSFTSAAGRACFPAFVALPADCTSGYRHAGRRRSSRITRPSPGPVRRRFRCLTSGSRRCKRPGRTNGPGDNNGG